MILAYGIIVISIVVGFVVTTHNTETNCWDNYTTEYEAILNCEER